MDRNMAADLNNKRASRSTCRLLPVLKFGRDDSGVFSCQAPEYFPSTVAEFLRMGGRNPAIFHFDYQNLGSVLVLML